MEKKTMTGTQRANYRSCINELYEIKTKLQSCHDQISNSSTTGIEIYRYNNVVQEYIDSCQAVINNIYAELNEDTSYASKG